MTYHRSTFLKSLTQIYLLNLSLSGRSDKDKPCYRRKIVFSDCEGYKVYCACAVSRDLCIGGPPKPHVTIFWPRIVYSLYNFYGATTTIKGSFILEHPHVKAIFGRKKKSSKSVPKIAFFQKFKGLNINCGHRDPQKCTSLAGTTSCDIFSVDISLGL